MWALSLQNYAAKPKTSEFASRAVLSAGRCHLPSLQPFTVLLLLPLLWSLLQHVSEAASAVNLFFSAVPFGRHAAIPRVLPRARGRRRAAAGGRRRRPHHLLRLRDAALHRCAAGPHPHGPPVAGALPAARLPLAGTVKRLSDCSLLTHLPVACWAATVARMGVTCTRQPMTCMVSDTAQVQKMQQLSGQFRCKRLAANCSTAYRGCAGPGAV